MKKKLAIIRADDTQMPFILKAKEMGIETHCFAWDKEGYTHCKGVANYFHPISIFEKEQILEECKKIKIDGIISKSDNAQPTVTFVAQNMGLICNSYESALIANSKFSARKAFLKNGVKSPPFALASENVDLSRFKYPLIVKPVDRKATVGVTKVEKEDDLKNAIQHAQNESYNKEAIIEEFIPGYEVSVDSISNNGKHYVLAIKERELAVGVNCNVKIAGHCPTNLSSDIENKIKIETQKALDAINFRYGASNTEFRVNDDGEIFIIEVNPRMAGNYSDILMKLHNGYDLVKGVIDVALGQFEEPVISEVKHSGIYFYTKETEWVKQIIINRKNDPDIIYAELNDLELPVLQYIGSNGGFFIYQSEKRRRWGK